MFGTYFNNPFQKDFEKFIVEGFIFRDKKKNKKQ